MDDDLLQLTLQLRNRKEGDKKFAKFRGDELIGNKEVEKVGLGQDLRNVFSPSNWSAIAKIAVGAITGREPDGISVAHIVKGLSNYSGFRQKFLDARVKLKYDAMLHPPLTYLGDAFQYRTADGSFNNAMNPHLGQAGAPYAKTVPSKTAPLGAMPDPEDIFEKLMAREEGGRESKSGLSSMLIYHATIIIHDIFRTNDNDKNISDSSSYLDLSPLYGYTMEMQRKIRDDRYKLGFLKPDTFAEDRLLRQPPGVCVMLVMYNRYHNYAVKQLYRINENGRFSVPEKYTGTKLVALARHFRPKKHTDPSFGQQCEDYDAAWKKYEAEKPGTDHDHNFEHSDAARNLRHRGEVLEKLVKKWDVEGKRKKFEDGYDAAWNKLDDDLFNTARLITCGLYIQISVHDYLRALMGFHQWDTNFTLDPRSDFDLKKTTRGTGNQVTVEFNLLYRFHCAISLKDEKYTEDFIKQWLKIEEPSKSSLPEFLAATAKAGEEKKARNEKTPEPWEVTFGIPGDPSRHYQRNKVTNLFDDEKLVSALTSAMDDPISNFGPRNVPRSLKAVEIMGITQARKWETGTLNDFREFFGMPRHATFESMTKNVEIQNALRELYEHPDKVELYPGIFCESDIMGLDPGPRESTFALWSAIFSDAITLVRSDRFYTVDWNTNSLTSWGMNEVTPDNETCKSSVFHRLIQRAFPGWFPYDSIRFFHPFYTSQQNAKFAKAQGYAPEFRMSQNPTSKNKEKDELVFDVNASSPHKPEKPQYITDFVQIAAALRDRSLMHPALTRSSSLPETMQAILAPEYQDTIPMPPIEQVLQAGPEIAQYLDDLMRSVVKRESIAMSNSTFQIDATRDFAIPVVTNFVADFLGFGSLLRTGNNPRGSYSENDIYQHITNCQIFLSYNADETKLLKRRKAFKTSLALLIELTRKANIAAANQWPLTRALFGKARDNPMSELGYAVATRVLNHESDTGKAAAILLLVCLDFAYNTVTAFTAVLDDYMRELYEAVNDPSTEPAWLTIQKLATSDSKALQASLKGLILKRSQEAVHMPILRTATMDVPNPNSPTEVPTSLKVKKGQTVILDLHHALFKPQKAGHKKANKADEAAHGQNFELLATFAGFAGELRAFQPKNLGSLALTSMVGFVARMRNARCGHDAQGRLKKINLGWTAEGYSNFMAPMRMDRIAEIVKVLPDDDPDKHIYTDTVLRPENDTYLTPSWDEMVPFPMTWKIRFDGFGESDYSWQGKPYGRLRSAQLPDDAPPWYQPRGPSHFGGTFGEGYKTAAPTPAETEPTLSTGCGMSGPGAPAGFH